MPSLLHKDEWRPKRKIDDVGSESISEEPILKDIKVFNKDSSDAISCDYAEGTFYGGTGFTPQELTLIDQRENDLICPDHNEGLKNDENPFRVDASQDECAIFAQYFVKKMSKYSDRVRAMVQYHFSDVLFKADMGFYDSGSSSS